MINHFPDGVWPTMITPFTPTYKIDYQSLEHIIEWYIERHTDGLFAVCQSSEMWHLSLAERVHLARFVAEKANGRVPVIASGHTGERLADQIVELDQIADTGIQGLVLVTNRLATPKENDDHFKKNVDILLQHLPPEIPLGLYECPYPKKRLISPELLRFCEDTQRFYFLKDTSCDLDMMRAKLDALSGRLKIYNANAATLHASYKLGISGYSGVMANFHPTLYRWHFENFAHSAAAEEVAELLCIASLIERQNYPVNAKYHMHLEGIDIGLYTRARDYTKFSPAQQLEVEQMRSLVNRFCERFCFS
ncbi:dihydrodipicolinate synthase family protein [candidate division KSB1 bacterium]|nr:dihydrodipicolinate synthase family protein [candidate division KSB1 bacterium]RQW03392.1 MAG: dihydrodipicolinate synthase family protein [candidate division KSB1 bacterium]